MTTLLHIDSSANRSGEAGYQYRDLAGLAPHLARLRPQAEESFAAARASVCELAGA
ncbi:MAG TPA: hypothetical protein VF482_19560 [Trebonia sp.]